MKADLPRPFLEARFLWHARRLSPRGQMAFLPLVTKQRRIWWEWTGCEWKIIK